METLDICPECVGKYITEYLRDCSNTGYLRVDTCVVWEDKKSEVVDKPPKEGEITKEDHDWF
jgi:hypothetical protein